MARGPGTRAGLSRDAVVAAAGAVLDRDGSQALSMRRVAAELGVAPNALYSHVADRNALIDALLDAGLAGVAAPDPAGDPTTELRAVMTATYDALLARPTLVPFYLYRQGSRGPNAQALGVIMDALLTRRGVSGDRVGDLRRLLITHTIGFAAFAVGSEGPLDDTVWRRTYELGLDLLLA